MTLKTAEKMSEVALTVEKTVQIFEANGTFVENYISWRGKNELTSLNAAFDNYSEVLALTA